MSESAARGTASDPKSWAQALATWVAILGGIVAILGGILALYSFISGQEASRAKEALAHIDHFSDATISASYGQFTQHMREVATTHGPQAMQDPKFLSAAVSDPAVIDHAIVVIGFFDNVGACTCKHLCDEQLVKMFLGSKAWDVYGLAFPFIAAQQADGTSPHGLGAGLTALAAAYKANRSLDCTFVGAPAD
jgi:hypothetical protein